VIFVKNRSAFWDNYKGVLILLVVFGHFIYNRAVGTAGGATNLIFTFIYLFHMPAFVFSSGYFSRSENARSAKAIVRLLLYYLVFNTLMMAYYTIERRELPSLLTPYASYWYLLCLIAWRLSAPYLSKVRGILPLTVAASLLVGYWAEVSNVLGLSRTVVFFPFFLLGYKFDAQPWLQKIKDRSLLLKLLGMAAAIGVAAVMCYVSRRYHLNVSMLCGMPYANGTTDLLRRGLIFLCAGAAIVMMLLTVPHGRVPMLTNIGKNSLLIYVVHRFVVLIFDRVVPETLPQLPYLALALAATAVTVIVFGLEAVNKPVAAAFERAAEAVTDKDEKKGRVIGLAAMLLALAVCSLPVVQTLWNRPAPKKQETVIADPEKAVEDSVVIAYVGDLVLLKEQVASGYDEVTDSYDFSGMFQYVKPYLTEADLAVGVLEGPMAGEEAGYSTSDYDDGIDFYLNFPDAFAENIKDSGIDLVTTANNHVMDRGAEGALRTLDVLDGAGLAHTGTYRDQAERENLLIVEADGLKIAVLSYTQLVNGYTTEEMVEQYPYLTAIMPTEDSSQYKAMKAAIEADFARAKASGADVIMVMPHMGTQFSLQTDDFQKKWNALFAELGADVILGDHSHCPQPLEYIGDTLVVNCPGNLADGFTGCNSDAKALVEIYLDRTTGRVRGAAVIPMYTQEYERGDYRALPIYDVFANESLKAEMWSRDLDRMREVQRLVTGTMLGQTVDIRQAQPRYYFMDGKYCPN